MSMQIPILYDIDDFSINSGKLVPVEKLTEKNLYWKGWTQNELCHLPVFFKNSHSLKSLASYLSASHSLRSKHTGTPSTVHTATFFPSSGPSPLPFPPHPLGFSLRSQFLRDLPWSAAPSPWTRVRLPICTLYCTVGNSNCTFNGCFPHYTITAWVQGWISFCFSLFHHQDLP